MKTRFVAAASLLAVCIAAASGAAQAQSVTPQSEQLRLQLAEYRGQRSALVKRLESIEQRIAGLRTAGKPAQLKAAWAQRAELRGQLHAMDATIRVVAMLEKNGGQAGASALQSTQDAMERKLANTAVALRVAREELEAARIGVSELSVEQATQAMQLAARQYHSALLTSEAFAENREQIAEAVSVVQSQSVAAAMSKKSDSGGGGAGTESPGKSRKPGAEIDDPVATTDPVTDSVIDTMQQIAEGTSTETTTEPAPEPAPETVVASEPVAEPTPEPAPEPEPEPVLAEASEPAPAPTAEEPESLEQQPAPEPESEVALAEEPAPEPEPAAEGPAPEPDVATAEEPAPAPEPEFAEIEEPAPAPEPEVAVTEEPAYVPEPEVVTAEEPAPAPEPEVVVSEEPAPAPEPVAPEEPAPEPEVADAGTTDPSTAPAEEEPAPVLPEEPAISEDEVDDLLADAPAPTSPPADEPVAEPEEPAPLPAEEPIAVLDPVPVEEPAPAEEPAPEPAEDPVAVIEEPAPQPEQPAPVVASGVATLSWSTPMTRANGAPLSMAELSGYEIYVIAESTGQSSVIPVNDPSAMSYTVENLAPDTYHFAISAVDTEQHVSDMSPIVSKTIADTTVASAP